ncbi:MAG: DUF4287 domain-containing protein [Kordiimonadaceae bacterium]|nr:DUF4287 domain-containing protein [Kordiimonadaceae bacterium]MBO6568513.1 DUF4287 domain-containing protein [Kordiimonadaceae bacterium]MBO6963758.1 DUF4287 domain-containing protein [Kordiimonadaceae bacterium]
MEENLKDKTGRDLKEWKAVLAKQSFEKHGEMLKFLKAEYNVSHGYANFIALKFREADAASSSDEDLVAAQYEKKVDLLPIYQKLYHLITSFGEEVQVAPKKAAVSFRRKRQFALVQPTTKTRVDLGLKFNDRAFEGRLETSGPFGSMCTHRVQLMSADDVDAEVAKYLRDAFDEAG